MTYEQAVEKWKTEFVPAYKRLVEAERLAANNDMEHEPWPFYETVWPDMFLGYLLGCGVSTEDAADSFFKAPAGWWTE